MATRKPADRSRVFTATAQFDKANTVGRQVYGDCPICGAANKFYINIDTGQWSCKAGKPGHVEAHVNVGNATQSGNVSTWLEVWLEYCRIELGSDAPWQELAEARNGVPLEAMQAAGVVWDGSRWLIPSYNMAGKIAGLSYYVVGSKATQNIEGLPVGLFGLNHLKACAPNTTVHIVEGPWSQMALNYRLNGNAVAIGVPGAATFKSDWTGPFTGHPVVACYDNDIKGQEGSLKALNTLVGVCPDLKQLKWPQETPDGYDPKDYFGNGGTLREFLSWVDVPITEEAESEPVMAFDKEFGTLSFDDDVLPVFRKWLHMTPEIENTIRIAYAVVLSNQVYGIPLWVQIVGPPGAGKTEVLRATMEVANTRFESTIRSKTLVSGWNNGDPSLLPRLRKKTLVIKDFTTVLSAPETERREVFATLRDAYDGEVSWSYGQNVRRNYKDIWFSVLAAVTAEVYAQPDSALGGRFIAYHPIKDTYSNSKESIHRAARTQDQTAMHEELSSITKEFLEVKIDSSRVPEVSDTYKEQIECLAAITAALRATVARDKYRKDLMLYKPQPEVGTRLVQQYIRLARFLALLEDTQEVTERVYNIVKQISMDTCIDYNFKIARLLAESDGMSIDQLTTKLNTTKATIEFRVDDMCRLNIISQKSAKNSAIPRRVTATPYVLSDHMKELWHTARMNDVYVDKPTMSNGHKPHIHIKAAAVIRTKGGQSLRLKVIKPNDTVSRPTITLKRKDAKWKKKEDPT